MTLDAWLRLIAFSALVLSAALQGLSASGHFPSEHRAATLRSPAGAAILYGSIAITFASVVIAGMFAWRTLPWYASIIGAGGVLLATPLLLQPFSDSFVNGRSALLVFSGIAAAIALAMLRYI
ncbi:hypothetical protein GJW-30_1_03898 [Variibacter gotjawalensis]|uniref:Uncharacterized protein n=1 Tax=Variibacter gotjawalensis TaxID=1333996 RepID=A0A0S3PZK4_9BRAD|nr:hypothetical protein [Variibacter gotjawalensis]NIK47179.1 hypothetical protein [Variibacter gotjawalensis]RZS49079.1 hypothetical protein EV661_1504 [Variibacter gotjawalensis]BAT61341.1 hypothetical protein GJW-30_1_03898 [Variibacter gotjawalensis]